MTQAAAGLEPSWDRFSQSPDQAWRDAAGTDLPGGVSPAGGLGQPGEGYGAAPVATINQASYAVGDLISVAIPRDVVQGLIDGDNTGLLLRKRDETDTGRLAFNKRESGNAGSLSMKPSADWGQFEGIPDSDVENLRHLLGHHKPFGGNIDQGQICVDWRCQPVG